jgi:hypothetical protein
MFHLGSSTNPSWHQRHRGDADEKKGNHAQYIVEGTKRLGHLVTLSPQKNDNQDAAPELFGLEHFLCLKPLLRAASCP